MSKLNDLIKEMCPNGVKFYKIKEISSVTIGEFVHKNKQSDDGQYPVYNGGTSNTGFYDEYNNDGHKVIISARGANAGFINRVKGKYWAGNSCYTININDESKLDWNYLYQYLKNNQSILLGVQQTGSIPAISKKQVEEFKIAIPPLEVQEEIVKILDKFGELEAELEVELEVELEARKSQYEFWRRKLLNRNNEIKKLSEVSDVIDSLHATPQYVENGYPMIRVADVKGGIVNTTGALKVDVETYNKFISKYKPQKGDIIISRVGSFGNLCIVGDEDMCLGQNTSIIHPKINDKYLYYYLSSDIVQDWIKNNVNGSGYKSLSLANINEIPIAVPSIQEQQKVANILDQFDKLVNSISEGLPAEIEFRRQQYEYYRNKLLSFEEL